MLVALVATLLAVLVAQVLPSQHWRQCVFSWWPHWLRLSAGRSAWGWLLSLALPLLLLALIQWLLHDWLFGVAYVALCVLALVVSWGPRDLERDVEALIYAEDEATQEQARGRLYADMNELDPQTAPLTTAIAVALLRRAMAVLFWFLLLGPVGAVGYRLLASQSLHPGPLGLAAQQSLRGVLAILEWPVAQLMVFSFALMGNCNPVINCWNAQGRWQMPSVEALLGATMAAALPEEPAASEAAALPLWERLPLLTQAMQLSWRCLGLWLALMLFWQLAVWLG